jgi:hypothetical protein
MMSSASTKAIPSALTTRRRCGAASCQTDSTSSRDVLATSHRTGSLIDAMPIALGAIFAAAIYKYNAPSAPSVAALFWEIETL